MSKNEQTYVKISRPKGIGGIGERWGEEYVSPTLNVFDNGDVRSVTLVTMKVPKRKSYGINPQASLMYPCSEELGQTLTVCHGAAVVVKGKKNNSVKAFAQNTRNEVRFIGNEGEGEISGALAAEPGAKQTTYLLIRKGKKCKIDAE